MWNLDSKQSTITSTGLGKTKGRRHWVECWHLKCWLEVHMGGLLSPWSVKSWKNLKLLYFKRPWLWGSECNRKLISWVYSSVSIKFPSVSKIGLPSTNPNPISSPFLSNTLVSFCISQSQIISVYYEKLNTHSHLPEKRKPGSPVLHWNRGAVTTSELS